MSSLDSSSLGLVENDRLFFRAHTTKDLTRKREKVGPFECGDGYKKNPLKSRQERNFGPAGNFIVPFPRSFFIATMV